MINSVVFCDSPQTGYLEEVGCGADEFTTDSMENDKMLLNSNAHPFKSSYINQSGYRLISYTNQELTKKISKEILKSESRKKSSNKLEKISRSLTITLVETSKDRNLFKKFFLSLLLGIFGIFLAARFFPTISISVFSVSLALFITLSFIYTNYFVTAFQAHRLAKNILFFEDGLQNLILKVKSAIKMVQEVELVSRGYRVSNPTPPISLIESSVRSKSARMNKVRLSLKQVILQLILYVSRLLELLNLDFGDEVDFEYIQVVVKRSLSEKGDILLKDLKDSSSILLQLSSFLSTSTRAYMEEDSSETKINTVLQNFVLTNRYILKESKAFERVLKNANFPTQSYETCESSGCKPNNLSTQVNTLSSLVCTLNAKLLVLTNTVYENQKTNSQDFFAQIASNSLCSQQFESLKDEIDMLHATYHNYRDIIKNTNQSPELVKHKSLETHHEEFPVFSENEGLEADCSMDYTDLGAPSEVFEGLGNKTIERRPKEKLSREERIERMKSKRKELSEARVKQQNSNDLIRELKSVLSDIANKQ